eukprot:jgi/Chlat1/8479/Chrsp80S07929
MARKRKTPLTSVKANASPVKPRGSKPERNAQPQQQEVATTSAPLNESAIVKRRRGRPRKQPLADQATDHAKANAAPPPLQSDMGAPAPPVKRGRGRPKKQPAVAAAPTLDCRGLTRKHSEKAVGKVQSAEKLPAKKRKGKSVQGSKHTTPSARKELAEVAWDNAVYKPGDVCYVTVREDLYVDKLQENETCEVCRKPPGEGPQRIVECNDCPRGIHLACLRPPLTEPPEGDFFCGVSNCATTFKSSNGTPSAKFWASDGVELGRIERIFKRGKDVELEVRWYYRGKDTGIERKLLSWREAFLSDDISTIPRESILCQAWVYDNQQYERYMSGEKDDNNEEADEDHEPRCDDVFICDYIYLSASKRFQRCRTGPFDSWTWSDDERDDAEDPVTGHPDFDFSLRAQQKLESAQKRARRSSQFLDTCRRSDAAEAVDRCSEQQTPDTAAGTTTVQGARSLLDNACAALRLAAMPKELPGRESELKDIIGFVEAALRTQEPAGGAQCMYISGVPGTGKTATVKAALRHLHEQASCGDLPSFQLAEVNGFSLQTPYHFALHETLTAEVLPPAQAQKSLEARFAISGGKKQSSSQTACVVVVDELDSLVTKKQQVLYSLFDWPNRPDSRLIVIGIANTMDLPERLQARVASRLGLRRLTFLPYNREQIQVILEARLPAGAFESHALELAARKVAAVSGDIRRALDLCRRAAEFARSRAQAMATQQAHVVQPVTSAITMNDIDAAHKEISSAVHMQDIINLPLHARLLLVVIALEQRKSGVTQTTFEVVAENHLQLCDQHQLFPPTITQLLDITTYLGALQLIVCEDPSQQRFRKIQLTYPIEDISFALRHDEDLKWVEGILR